ncbi:hypothetical protein EDD15DRAFT_2313114 [Pisolithus albus]|nr:hypothetical protein EDD15DRAFT_2313114 [Pisolithus albus]
MSPLLSLAECISSLLASNCRYPTVWNGRAYINVRGTVHLYCSVQCYTMSSATVYWHVYRDSFFLGAAPASKCRAAGLWRSERLFVPCL